METTKETNFNLLPPIQVVIDTEPQMNLCKCWSKTLKLVALQNGLRLNNPKELNKAVRILKQSILNN